MNNSKTLNDVAKENHGKELTSSRYSFLETLSHNQIKKVGEKLAGYPTFDVTVRIKGYGDNVIEFKGDGLDSVDVNMLTLNEWRELYGFDSTDRP